MKASALKDRELVIQQKKIFLVTKEFAKNDLYTRKCKQITALMSFPSYLWAKLMLFFFGYLIKQMVNSSAHTIELWLHLGVLLSTWEARVALDDSYASFVPSSLPLHAEPFALLITHSWLLRSYLLYKHRHCFHYYSCWSWESFHQVG